MSKTPPYNSIYTISISIDHHDQDAKDVTPAMLREAVLMKMNQLALQSNADWFEAFYGPDDTTLNF